MTITSRFSAKNGTVLQTDVMSAIFRSLPGSVVMFRSPTDSAKELRLISLSFSSSVRSFPPCSIYIKFCPVAIGRFPIYLRNVIIHERGAERENAKIIFMVSGYTDGIVQNFLQDDARYKDLNSI